MKKLLLLLAFPVLMSSYSVSSDEVIVDDLIASQSLCVGDQCADGEDFDLDTVRLKIDDPVINFDDTSVSASFPKNDWSMGITDNGVPGPAQFFINDSTGGLSVLLLDAGADGGVALGAGSTIEAGAISVGTSGAERRIVNVADGVDDTDAATMGQFTTFSDNINTNFATELAAERTAIDDDLTTLQDKIDELVARVDAVIDELNN